MKVTYFGQACTLIEGAGRRILTDPWLTEGAYFGTWFHTHLLRDAGVSPASVLAGGVDYLFLSHEHQDHLDPVSLRAFARDIPILMCRFPTPRFRRHVESLGFRNIQELSSGEERHLGDGLTVTLFQTAEYTNDSAILVEAENCKVFNETDCKLGYEDLERIARKGIDIGFYMFSGANWFPMLFDYPEEMLLKMVRRRRAALVNGFVKRVKLTRPRIAVPSAGPCMVLDPDLLWLNWAERGIFIDPREAEAALKSAAPEVEPLVLAASDAWDSRRGLERHSPEAFRENRKEYILDASKRMVASINLARAQEPPAGEDFASAFKEYFNGRVGALTDAMRRRINAELAWDVRGPQGGQWTVDFTKPGPQFVREGITPGWTYRIEVEDKLLYPFVAGKHEFLEDLFLSLRARFAERPVGFNEPLYHFLYDPDPGRLNAWYATR